MTRVGFVGLGSQGAPMARRIIDAGYATTLWARRTESLEPFADTAASVAATPAELGAASDILGICVVDDAGVDEVLRGPDGALAAMGDGAVVVIHSTVHPLTCLRLHEDFPSLRIVDAPVSGGGHKAADGELLVMVGGADEDVERCRPILQTFGDPVLHIGPLGSGQEAKVLNNTVFAAQLALAAEVFEVATARRLDQHAIATILASGSGRSYAAEVVAGGGYDLEGLAPFAGELLAKDVGILTDRAALSPSASTLLAAADSALERMGVALGEPKGPPMTADDLYRSVMTIEPPDAPTPLDRGERDRLFETIWNRPGLSVRDRRIVTIVCLSAAVDVEDLDAHVYAALASGDLTADELNEVTLHFAVYCGWPRASHLEMTVRGQWQRLHEERGEDTPPFPERSIDELGPPDHAERIAGGLACFEEVNLIQAPSQDSPYFHAGILNFVFGHLWQRPGLSRRDRRLVTIPCVGVGEAFGPIWSHVTSALGSGDLTYDEVQEVILHFSAYSGVPRATPLGDVAVQWQTSQP